MNQAPWPNRPEYPAEWHVRFNYCRCPSSDCNCDFWAVFDPKGVKFRTMPKQDDAESYAAGRNRKDQVAAKRVAA